MPRYQITPSYLSRISYCHVVSFACPHMPQSCLTPVASPYAHPLHHAVSKWCLHDLRYPSLPGCVFYLVHGCSGRLVETDTKGHPLARPSLILEKTQFFRLQPGGRSSAAAVSGVVDGRSRACRSGSISSSSGSSDNDEKNNNKMKTPNTVATATIPIYTSYL